MQTFVHNPCHLCKGYGSRVSFRKKCFWGRSGCGSCTHRVSSPINHWCALKCFGCLWSITWVYLVLEIIYYKGLLITSTAAQKTTFFFPHLYLSLFLFFFVLSLESSVDICWLPLPLLLDELSMDKRGSDHFLSGRLVCRYTAMIQLTLGRLTTTLLGFTFFDKLCALWSGMHVVLLHNGMQSVLTNFCGYSWSRLYSYK